MVARRNHLTETILGQVMQDEANLCSFGRFDALLNDIQAPLVGGGRAASAGDTAIISHRIRKKE